MTIFGKINKKYDELVERTMKLFDEEFDSILNMSDGQLSFIYDYENDDLYTFYSLGNNYVENTIELLVIKDYEVPSKIENFIEMLEFDKKEVFESLSKEYQKKIGEIEKQYYDDEDEFIDKYKDSQYCTNNMYYSFQEYKNDYKEQIKRNLNYLRKDVSNFANSMFVPESRENILK